MAEPPNGSGSIDIGKPIALDFFDFNEIRNIAASMAFFNGCNFEDAIKPLRDAQTARLTAVREKYSLEKTYLEEQIGRIGAEIEQSKRIESSLKREVDSLEHSVVKLKSDLMSLQQDRSSFESAYFVDERRRLDEEIKADYEGFLSEIKQREEVAQYLSQLDGSERNLNSSVYDETIKDLESRVKETEEELNQAQKFKAKLAAAPITEKTAGFLIWAGYSALAGTAYLISKLLLASTSKSSDDALSHFLYGVIAVIRRGTNWRILLYAFLFVITIAAILVALFVLVKKMNIQMKRLDPKWMREEKEKNKERNKLFSMEDTKGDIYSKFPDFNYRSYLKLLATFPYVLIAALIIALGAVFNYAAPDAQSPPPLQAFSEGVPALFLGFTFTFLVYSAALVYTVTVMKPRWQKPLDEPNSPRGMVAYLKIYWEIFASFTVLLLALIVKAIAIIRPSDKLTVLANLLGVVFLCLSSLWLSCGLVLRGAFRNLAMLERRKVWRRKQLETYKIAPSSWHYFADDYFEKAADRSKYHQQLRDQIDNQRLKQPLIDRLIQRIKDGWRRPKKQLNRLIAWIKSKPILQEPGEAASPLDQLAGNDPPNIVKEKYLARLIEETKQVIEMKRSEIKAVNGKLNEQSSILQVTEARLLGCEKELRESIKEVSLLHEREYSIFRTAYDRGLYLKNVLFGAPK